MIVVDANLLLYAYNSTSPRHRAAKRWPEGALSGTEPVFFPWVSVLAFLRISTNARAFAAPLSMDEAQAVVDSWLAQPSASILHPGESHWTILRRLLREADIRGPKVTDAHLALAPSLT